MVDLFKKIPLSKMAILIKKMDDSKAALSKTESVFVKGVIERFGDFLFFEEARSA